MRMWGYAPYALGSVGRSPPETEDDGKVAFVYGSFT